ncbi:DNA adenine methylase [Phaeobacter gallaeciensis]|uniref:Site-specific DNA-methyltransferase (adenine-specific) n=1 Tax=Phaeobacter gallaeciensis TaxID=60890 RepID=A0AAC9Z7E1_9RHOB|nr:Dam family site-specific DNA-(adenine-N6)-methyltransferase [Phaeobacter gallaeciensis]AHD07944.1 DNA adenine methylase (dam) [Phaeobacter gallaeciensis DSM 26640]ATE91212.1 DNA adenine methylase (dam) [Phaeobacter gallaeciensis]ATE95487.1 DNA adenine methylase (dam) [Phaeobacter gallaeciensis]ATE99826.1 DNA adenine methylase (dam) [Phaeobacter gallaeciensis]ATF04259.1 DNA adenine methylase (dam) [Phaeobacter gallaeciensis]
MNKIDETHSNLRSRPLLRWAGSKRSALPELGADAPAQFERYIEPFVGSAVLFDYLRPEKALLSDLNTDLINFYRQVQTGSKEIYNAALAIPREKEVYLSVREKFKTEQNHQERAVQFFYLNRNCFNGLYRTNKQGMFNVPFAASKPSSYPTQSQFEDFATRLQSADLKCGDFFDIVSENVRAGDFVYLDPPYLKSEGRIFSEYVKGHFSRVDLDRLRQLLSIIDNVGAKFILSFIDDEIIYPIRDLWPYRTYSVQRNISGFSASRKKSGELLIRNW